jgi:hypothetical protein
VDLKKRYHVSQRENILKESDEKGRLENSFFLLHISFPLSLIIGFSCCRRVAEIFRTFLFVTCAEVGIDTCK